MIFVSVVTAINLFILWFMPKRLTRQEIYITWGIVAAVAIYLDFPLGIIFDFYDLLETRLELTTLVIELILPASFGIIFLNFMPENRTKFIVYLIGWVAFSLFFEWLTTYFDFLNYKAWLLWYSTPFYTSGGIFLRWHLRFIRSNRGKG